MMAASWYDRGIDVCMLVLYRGQCGFQIFVYKHRSIEERYFFDHFTVNLIIGFPGRMCLSYIFTMYPDCKNVIYES